MRRVAVAAAAIATLLVPGAAATAPAPTEPAQLPSPSLPLTPQPPLTTGAVLLEQRIPGRLRSRVLVSVDAAPDGAVRSVRVRQLLTVSGRGDYSFAVAAPVVAVERAPESESDPGQREGAILWQGFSAGRRVLGADARLDPAAAAPVLPLRVRVTRVGPRTVRVSIVNRTGTRLDSYAARAVPGTVAAALDAIRRDLRAGRLSGAHSIELLPPIGRKRRGASAPLAVRAGLTLPEGATLEAADGLAASTSGRRVEARGTLTGGSEATLTLRLAQRPRRLPAVDVAAAPVPPSALLSPPSGFPSWRAAARAGAPATRGEAFVDRALGAVLSLARVHQYDQFVVNPDPQGASTATYRYRIVDRPAAAPAKPAPQENDGSGVETAIVLALLAAGLVGAVIAWSYA